MKSQLSKSSLSRAEKVENQAEDQSIKIKQSIIYMLEKINQENYLRRIHNFIQRIYISQ